MLLNLKKILFLLVIYTTASYASVEKYFDEIKNDPNALYSFFKKMPKGGELHYHLAGGVFAETLISLANANNICLEPNSKKVFFADSKCRDISINSLTNNPKLYTSVIHAWSMEDFIPNGESSSEHFFSTFHKFVELEREIRPQTLAATMKRASDQEELYLEVMILPDKGKSSSFGNTIIDLSDFKQKKEKLLSTKQFKKNIDYTIQESKSIIEEARKLLGCNQPSPPKVCTLKIKFQYYVLREQEINNFFAQALNAFIAASRSKEIVGVNLVQAENGIIALRDYSKQMQVFDFLKKNYPNVNVALHAGELNPNSVTPENLRFHITEAIQTGHAQRVGHGVTIAYENDANKLLNHMANKKIAVEINLTSNDLILNIKGKSHPLNYYLKNKVPVVLSTDDEGILRTDLTRQYVTAVLNHNLDYTTIKNINRNALTYNFLPGKSFWLDASLNQPVNECKNLDSHSCQTFIKNSQKAKLQWQLEKNLEQFENTYN